MVETKWGCRFFWLKLDTSPRSAILDFPSIIRRVLPTSYTGDATLKLADNKSDRGCVFVMFAVVFVLWFSFYYYTRMKTALRNDKFE